MWLHLFLPELQLNLLVYCNFDWINLAYAFVAPHMVIYHSPSQSELLRVASFPGICEFHSVIFVIPSVCSPPLSSLGSHLLFGMCPLCYTPLLGSRQAPKGGSLHSWPIPITFPPFSQHKISCSSKMFSTASSFLSPLDPCGCRCLVFRWIGSLLCFSLLYLTTPSVA